MGTLAVTYNGTTKNYTLTGAPAVAYGGSTRLSASGWSGTRVLKCANKLMSTDVTIGSLKLPTKGMLAKTDIKLEYTVKGETYYTRNVNDTSSLTIPEGYNKATFFAVGGGGTSGGVGGRISRDKYVYCCTGGGGGGYTASKTVDVSKGDVFTFSIGAGAKGVWNSSSAPASRGGTTYVYKNGSTIVSAAGGYTSAGVWATTGTSAGGAGGSGGGGSGWWNGDYSANRGAAGNGGTNGGNGTAGGAAGGKGQGTSTTYHGVVYSGGGGGGNGGKGSLGRWSSNGIGGNYGGGNGIGYTSTGQTSGTEGSGGGGGGYRDEWGSGDEASGSDRWSNSDSSYSLISGGSGAVVIRLYEQ